MKHPHYDKIVAKAANTSLVVFCKPVTESKWQEVSQLRLPDFGGTHDYFLCLPQHKEVCLHWLSGGESQLEYTHQSYPIWNSIYNDAKDWSMGHVFMDDSLNIRIKPKKEKRWIGVNGSHVTDSHFKTLDKAKSFISGCPSLHSRLTPDNWQFIEIEVEV